MRMQKITVSVIGGHVIDARVEQVAYETGQLVAELGCVLVCGGLTGVMEVAARGAKEAGGLTIGLLPGKDKAEANPYIDIALPTSIGFARNAMVACSADIVVALPGSYGTNCEICYALVYKRPVIDLGGWQIKGMVIPKDFEEAKKVMADMVEKLRAGELVSGPVPSELAKDK